MAYETQSRQKTVNSYSQMHPIEWSQSESMHPAIVSIPFKTTSKPIK